MLHFETDPADSILQIVPSQAADGARATASNANTESEKSPV
jgi:hypothetical protein